jgi:AcrR family transcriptional regulator
MNKTATIDTPAEDARRIRILEGAKQAFLAYGFQRTTMDDIARASEISRPALYLMFKNKTDIYRALASGFMEEMTANARRVLASDLPLADKLDQSVGCALAMAAEIETSPHGGEIMDMKNNLAGDIIATWRARMSELVEAAVGRQAEANRVDLAARGHSARTLADMLLDAVDGMKNRQIPLDAQRATIAAYITVIDRAVAG